MTFYEAALRVLEEAGSPLPSTDITKRAIDKGLLSHVGKTPEVTMLLRLAAMAKRPRDRRLQVTVKDTFALTDWMLPEDSDALAATGVLEPHPEDALPPLRPEERHPQAHAEYLRTIGRSSGDRKRRDDDRKKKYPPAAEVAFEALQEAGTALTVGELLARLKARDAVADDTSNGALVDALASDNQRRVDDSRRPQFAAARGENNELQLSLDAGAEGVTPADAQQAFCLACNLKFENGRVVLRHEQRRHERQAEGVQVSGDEQQTVASARAAVKDARKAFARIFRARLNELEQHTFEKACSRLLRALHFHDLKVNRRGKDGPLVSARRREGSLELRYAIRFGRVGGAVERRHVQELRREAQQSGAQVALLISASDVRGDVRGECTSGTLVQLWAGDALSEKFFEAKLGVTVVHVAEFFDFDQAFFEQARADAEESMKRREERQRERDRRDDEPPSAPVEAEAADGADDAEGEEGDEAEGPEGANGEGRRRRRRRRRRRGGSREELPLPAERGEGGGEGPAVEAAPADKQDDAADAPLLTSPRVAGGGSDASTVSEAVEPAAAPEPPPAPDETAG